MESSSPISKSSEPPPHRWAILFGTMIALVTLTLPLSAIALYSSPNTADLSPRPPYAVSHPR